MVKTPTPNANHIAETPFKLFGGDSDTEEEEKEPLEEANDVGVAGIEEQSFAQAQGDKIIQAQPTQRKETVMQNAPLFFFHFGNTELSKRYAFEISYLTTNIAMIADIGSYFCPFRSNYKDDGVFMRTETM